MPVVNTKGAASSQGFGEFAKTGPATYIEDVFSTYLYAGSPSNNTIVNGINLSENGGLVWMKSRTDYTTTGYNHALYDTARGNLSRLSSNTTSAASTGSGSTYMSSFNSNGFTLVGNGFLENYSPNMVSWTFRKQAKFFDVVTYTGTGASNPVAHSLASTPGWLIIKATSTTSNWFTMHRASGTYVNGALDMTVGLSPSGTTATSALTSTTVNVQTLSASLGESLNTSGVSYVMYVFASDAGGFGNAGTDNVITCGSFTTDASSKATVNLGYEPQWLMYKTSNMAESWVMVDTMRGMGYSANNVLQANTSNVEGNYGDGTSIPTATGFNIDLSVAGGYFASKPFIYIAIRRGPMKTPTSGTSVFSPTATTVASGTAITTGFVTDAVFGAYRDSASNRLFGDRLRGNTRSLITNDSGAEFSGAGRGFGFTSSNTGFIEYEYTTSATQIYWALQRAPGFFDEVCYTGTGANRTVTHNLGVVPELMIVKTRSTTGDWPIYSTTTGNNYTLYLNGTVGQVGPSAVAWNNTTPTSSVFTVGTFSDTNASGVTYVAYLFATCPGVSKVGSYTGTGTLTTINCGFTGGARFVLIKRTDSTSNWFVWDSARGMVSGTDPSLSLNTTSAESNANSVYTATTGFQLLASPSADVNTSGGTYIFLAIA